MGDGKGDGGFLWVGGCVMGVGYGYGMGMVWYGYGMVWMDE